MITSRVFKMPLPERSVPAVTNVASKKKRCSTDRKITSVAKENRKKQPVSSRQKYVDQVSTYGDVPWKGN